MKAVISLNTDPVIAVGDITELKQFPAFRASKLADGLQADFPMLRCPIAAEDAHFVPTGVIRYRTTFGCLPVNNLSLLTIQVQINGVQIYWLADLADPEVWATYDVWKEAGRLPILLDFDEDNERDCTFCVPEIPRQHLAFEQLRTHKGIPTADSVWKTMATLSVSGFLPRVAVSMLPDVRLERVLVNVLATKRVEPFVKSDCVA
ncbi:hypothetical protein B0G80_7550 [Paraburkholderia sp. BL6669N2]|uniref:hypothetical protein n=1 Tax=Paraburkholderia sp. BL6669N2 TaxID=1938807 RepID=UPI000E26E9E7|nr:hypothetical protein [Paraburkholderia sp. BL6669N2]REG51066.1 hypothetical protein B0G80_7550 [Paraburkholderia sp. BL6669N2]